MAKSMIEWNRLEAPSLAELEAIADEAYSRLPARFRALTGDLLIRVEDFPTDEVLDSLGIESPFDLLGLYSGIDLAQKERVRRDPRSPTWCSSTGVRFSIIGPSTRRRLAPFITHVLVHEIGHHFGLSDADMERIEAEAVG